MTRTIACTTLGPYYFHQYMLKTYLLSLVAPLLQIGHQSKEETSLSSANKHLLLENRLLDISKNKHEPNQIILL